MIHAGTNGRPAAPTTGGEPGRSAAVRGYLARDGRPIGPMYLPAYFPLKLIERL